MRSLVVLFVSLFGLSACVPEMEDNSLEAASVEGFTEESLGFSGTLAVTAGEAEGDWILEIDGSTFTYHSPSRADLSTLDGLDVKLKLWDAYEVSPSLLITDDEGVAFYSTADARSGGSQFSRYTWEFGETIGKGELPEPYEGETLPVFFKEVIMHTDDGEIVLLPGEPTRVEHYGDSYRLTVTAAYEADNPVNAKCGAPDVLAIELLRAEEVPSETLTRSAAYEAPVGQCG